MDEGVRMQEMEEVGTYKDVRAAIAIAYEATSGHLTRGEIESCRGSEADEEGGGELAKHGGWLFEMYWLCLSKLWQRRAACSYWEVQAEDQAGCGTIL